MFSYKAMLPVAFAALALGACDGGKDLRDPKNPSGFKIPRYVSISSGEVNGRAGPSEEHPVLWTYRARGLPVQIVAETTDWRRICDPEGGLSWVKRGFLNGPRYVMRTKEARLAVLRRPAADATPVAWMSQRSLASLDHCEKGWCKVKVGDTVGWTQEREVWGTAPTAQCRGASGMTRSH